MELNRKSALPLHAQAEKVLRELIESKEYKAGKFLPKEVELSKQPFMRMVRRVARFSALPLFSRTKCLLPLRTKASLFPMSLPTTIRSVLSSSSSILL